MTFIIFILTLNMVNHDTSIDHKTIQKNDYLPYFNQQV